MQFNMREGNKFLWTLEGDGAMQGSSSGPRVGIKETQVDELEAIMLEDLGGPNIFVNSGAGMAGNPLAGLEEGCEGLALNGDIGTRSYILK